jgi:hypothetical protein
MLGPVSSAELTTAQIRNWHRTVMDQVGRYTANRALSMLKAALALSEEDFRVRAPARPSNGTRSIPMSATLRKMLMAWRLLCPRNDGKLLRVFPGPGRLQPWPLPRTNGGGPLLYRTFVGGSGHRPLTRNLASAGETCDEAMHVASLRDEHGQEYAEDQDIVSLRSFDFR